jgi:apolipoprotein N-acyltransferase
MADAPLFDPWETPPNYWQRHAGWLAPLAVFVLTVVLTVNSFPPFHAAEFGYAFAAPAILWAYSRPSFRCYAGTLFGAQAVAWTILLAWLRHVTWVGWLLLGPVVGAWIGVWYLAVWWTMPRVVGRSVPVRLAAQAGLAGLWVVVEWSRTWLLGGFPWLPLAASQWQRTAVLQIAAYTGAYGVSFVLIMMNLGFAAYAHRLLREEVASILRKRSQEFMLALFLLLACLCVMMRETVNRRATTQPLARVAFVQPDIPQEVKWDPAKAAGIVQTLRGLTLAAGAARPDVILWPEATLPQPVNADPGMRAFVQSLADDTHATLLFGAVAVDHPGTPAERWSNAAFVAAPGSGLQAAYYAKRHLVPFGEYVPLRPLFGWMSKFVPLPGDFAAGTDPSPLVVSLPRGAAAFGPLICYEDLFPRLARDSVRSGADVLAVLTNDAWYGEEGAAYQQAAHSVLRAVETRRPVLRCGNDGWSGWIDEYGGIRDVLAAEDGSVYLRGTTAVNVSRDVRWAGVETFYVRHGDWFVLVGALLALGAAALLRGPPPAPTAVRGRRFFAPSEAGAPRPFSAQP